jgi:hypothetical protein
MHIKLFATAILSLLSLTSAHSWCHCTSHRNEEILQWMKANPPKSLSQSH